MRVRWSGLAVLLTAGVGGFARGDTFDEVLKARGLTRSGVQVRLDSEAKVLEALRGLQPELDAMKEAGRALAEAKGTVEQFRAKLDEESRLNTGAQDIERRLAEDPQNKTSGMRKGEAKRQQRGLIAQKKTAAGEVKRLRPQKPGPRELAKLEDDYAAGNRRFYAEATDVEALHAGVVDEYKSLTADAELKAAISEHERSAKVRLSIGPSESLRKAMAGLAAYKKAFPPVDPISYAPTGGGPRAERPSSTDEVPDTVRSSPASGAGVTPNAEARGVDELHRVKEFLNSYNTRQDVNFQANQEAHRKAISFIDLAEEKIRSGTPAGETIDQAIARVAEHKVGPNAPAPLRKRQTARTAEIIEFLKAAKAKQAMPPK